MAEKLRGPFEKFVDSPYYSVYAFEKWVERCKKCIAYQGRYFEKRDRHRTSTKFRLGVDILVGLLGWGLAHPKASTFATSLCLKYKITWHAKKKWFTQGSMQLTAVTTFSIQEQPKNKGHYE
jgi:hypothetical protein